MVKTVEYQGKSVFYTIEGEGEALVFIHGYLESSEIWADFTSRFTKNFKVICIDIPGHGNSEVIYSIHQMSEMARAVLTVIDAEKLEKVVVFGHSLGGYITMEFLNHFPERVRGFSLFHSTCFADNDEKKLNRDREISLVMCGKKMQIVHTNIPKGFAHDNIDKLAELVSKAKLIASTTPDEGIIALLQGMKRRQDLSSLLSHSKVPALIIWGKKDNYIGEDVFKKLVALTPKATVIILNDSGHMGFLEEADCVYAGIIDFLYSLE